MKLDKEIQTQLSLWDVMPYKRKSYKEQLIDFVKYKEHLEEQLNVMCRRCVNHEMCQGTGCGPKDDLRKLLLSLRLKEDD